MPARKVSRAKRGRKRVVRRNQRRAAVKSVNVHRMADIPERPRVYTYPLSERICERIANGESTAEVCRDPAMPSWGTLAKWRRRYSDFNARYRTARESCCELWADETILIADDATNDYVQRQNGGKVFDRESFERSRLRIDTRKWQSVKLLRHVYGERAEVDVRTPDGVSVKVSERNALLDAIVRMVQPKSDPASKPDGRAEEPRER